MYLDNVDPEIARLVRKVLREMHQGECKVEAATLSVVIEEGEYALYSKVLDAANKVMDEYESLTGVSHEYAPEAHIVLTYAAQTAIEIEKLEDEAPVYADLNQPGKEAGQLSLSLS